MRRVPSPFGWAINALNAEQEFSPRDIAFTQPITSPGGPLRPYWVELRNSAYMVGQTIALSRLERPSPAIAIQELPYALPPESTYRRAQAEFVSTFRDLVEKWREEDWDSAKCFKKYPHVGKRIQTLLRRRPLVFLPTSGGPALLINPFSPSAPFGVQRIPKKKDRPISRARHDALTLFIRIAQHPTHNRIGKCVRCGRYFWGRPRQKCCPRPRRCGSYLAAIEATKQRLNRERNEKLDRARQAIKEWGARKPQADWKPWVAGEAQISHNWLTRAIKSGELEAPHTMEGRK